MDYYSTPQDVINYTGIEPKDLGLETEQELNNLIEKWLKGIKSLIDADRNRDYEREGKVPEGIHLIALRIASHLCSIAILKRDTPIVRLDEFTIQLVEDEIFTTAIQNDLKRFPAKPRFQITVTKGKENG